MAAELQAAWRRMRAATMEKVPADGNLLLRPVAAAWGKQRELTDLIENAATLPVAAQFADLPGENRDSLFSQISLCGSGKGRS